MKPSVKNMTSSNGNKIAGQLIITTDQGEYFQSYDSIIVFVPRSGPVQLDRKYWNYSKTTGKYMNLFLGETKKETEAKIKAGTYILADLN